MNKKNLIKSITVECVVSLGKTRITLDELSKLSAGSVMELNVLAGDPLSLLVNGVLVAKGEAVVVNEKYGIRITEVIEKGE